MKKTANIWEYKVALMPLLYVKKSYAIDNRRQEMTMVSFTSEVVG